MADILTVLPELDGQEQLFCAGLIADMTDAQAQTFGIAYRAQRKDPIIFLICQLIGFVFLSGIGRFYIGQVGMGILYLLTGGLCWVGTLIDVFRFKTIAFQTNSLRAQQIAIMAKASG